MRPFQRDSSKAMKYHLRLTNMHFRRDSESRNPKTIHHIASGMPSQSGEPSAEKSSSVCDHGVWVGRHWASLCGSCAKPFEILVGKCGICSLFFCDARNRPVVNLQGESVVGKWLGRRPNTR
eukprot:7629582-Pyramimonas_sp.AAC.2